MVSTTEGSLKNLSLIATLLLAGAASGAAQSAATATQRISNNTPGFVKTAKNLGPVNRSTVIDVGIWLNVRNRGELDSFAQELYDPSSPRYHTWLTSAEFVSRFAPTADEVKTVEEFFSSHNLPVVSVGPNNMFVRARGTVASVEKAFQVQINSFELNGKTYRANTSDPAVASAAAALVSAVSGLDNLEYQHPIVSRSVRNPNGTTQSAVEAAASANDPNFFTDHCFTGARTETYGTSGTLSLSRP